MEKIAIVTDSTADIPEEIAERYHVYTVPITINLDGESLEDGSGGDGNVNRLSREKFYNQQLPHLKTFPTTAAPSIGTFQKVYQRVFENGYQHIISIHLAKELSGTINSAILAAREFGDQINVIDGRQVTLALGYQVLACAEILKKYEDHNDDVSSVVAIQTMIKKMENMRTRLRVVGILDTLEYLKRSGRVSWMQAALGSLLNLKLMIEVKNGHVDKLGQARTKRAGLDRLLEQIKGMGELEHLAVIHTGGGAEYEAPEILETIVSSLQIKPLSQMCIWMTPVLGAHVGPNLIGLTAVACDPID